MQSTVRHWTVLHLRLPQLHLPVHCLKCHIAESTLGPTDHPVLAMPQPAGARLLGVAGGELYLPAIMSSSVFELFT